MLSTPVQKDIGEYEEKLALGLSTRTLVGLGSGVALALAFTAFTHLALGIAVTDTALIAMAIVMACFAAGYAKPYGLPMSEAAPLILRDLLTPSTLTYKSSLALFLERRAAEAAKRKPTAEEKKERREKRALQLDDEDCKDYYREVGYERARAQLERARAEAYGTEI